MTRQLVAIARARRKVSTRDRRPAANTRASTIYRSPDSHGDVFDTAAVMMARLRRRPQKRSFTARSSPLFRTNGGPAQASLMLAHRRQLRSSSSAMPTVGRRRGRGDKRPQR